ncbi:Uncharacterised protein [Mycobacterium tuberculosis]|nr:Uncharacterised protein [Mycobacterium tuberculosis]
MMSSGSTVLRFDFDIFSIGPISTDSFVVSNVARRLSPTVSMLISAGEAKVPSCFL